MQANNTLTFREVDQVAVFKPITVWTDRVYHTDRLPEYIELAFQRAFGARPGPVYLDLSWDPCESDGFAWPHRDGRSHPYGSVPEEEVRWSKPRKRVRSFGDPREIDNAVSILESAERPVLVYGSRLYWSGRETSCAASSKPPGFRSTPRHRVVVL